MLVHFNFHAPSWHGCAWAGLMVSVFSKPNLYMKSWNTKIHTCTCRLLKATLVYTHTTVYAVGPPVLGFTVYNIHKQYICVCMSYRCPMCRHGPHGCLGHLQQVWWTGILMGCLCPAPTRCLFQIRDEMENIGLYTGRKHTSSLSTTPLATDASKTMKVY